MPLKYKWECLTEACPEQYDVWDGDKLVGYVRVRGSLCRAFAPDVCGECIYEQAIGDSGWDGCFETEGQRKYHLTLIELAIRNWIKENEQH